MNKIIYTKYSNERTPEFAVKTDIVKYSDGSKCVRKSPADCRAFNHVKELLRWNKEMKDIFQNTIIEPCMCQWNDEAEGVDFDFVQGVSLEKQLDVYLEKQQYDKLFDMIKGYIEMCRKAANEKFEYSDAFKNVFGNVKFSNTYNAFKVSNIDMIFANVLINEDKWTLIDYEWCFDFPIPLEFVLYRALHYYIYTRDIRSILIDKGIFKLLGDGEKDIAVFDCMEKSFQKYIEGNTVAVRTLYQMMGQPGRDVVGMLVNGAPGYTVSNIEVYKNAGSGFVLESKADYYAYSENGIYTVKVPVEKGISMLRIDPASCGCRLKLNKFTGYLDGKEQNLAKLMSHNAYMVEDDVYTFSDNDPWFWIDIPEGVSGAVELQYELTTIDDNNRKSLNELAVKTKEQNDVIKEQEESIADLKRQIANLQDVLGQEQAKTIAERGAKESLQRQVESLKTANEQLNENIASIYESLSWKVTKPLRGAKDIFRSK